MFYGAAAHTSFFLCAIDMNIYESFGIFQWCSQLTPGKRIRSVSNAHLHSQTYAPRPDFDQWSKKWTTESPLSRYITVKMWVTFVALLVIFASVILARPNSRSVRLIYVLCACCYCSLAVFDMNEPLTILQ